MNMTIRVKRNIVSARLSAKDSSGRRLSSGMSARAMPKSTLKTTICSISPSTTERAKFSGNVSRTMSCQVRGAVC